MRFIKSILLAEILSGPAVMSRRAFASNGNKLWQDSLPVLDKILAQQSVKLRYDVKWRPEGLFAKSPINSTAGMTGLTWRACNSVTSKLAELVVAQPVTAATADIAQGTRHGHLTGAASLTHRFRALRAISAFTISQVGTP